MRIALVVLTGLLTLALASCNQASLLTNVDVTKTTIAPNGDGADDSTLIQYSVSRDAHVTIYLTDSAGKRYMFRDDKARTPGDFNAQFDGAYVPPDAPNDRRILPDGTYTYTVVAEDAQGYREEREGQITIKNADSEPVEIIDLRASPNVITPDGDNEQDESVITYGISKRAYVTVYAVGPDGNRYVLESEKKPREAGLPPSITFDGTYGTRKLPNGKYSVHIQARDEAGNVTDRSTEIEIQDSGIPRLEIRSVEFSPPVVPLGGVLNVTIKVQNTGDTPLKTIGPAPGTEYTTGQTFNYWTHEDGGAIIPKYFERPGHWRVGVQWEQAGQTFPIRWALTEPDIGPNGEETFPPLMPGEEATITGKIRILLSQVRNVDFWAGIEQGGVGFPGGERGRKQIIISY